MPISVEDLRDDSDQQRGQPKEELSVVELQERDNSRTVQVGSLLKGQLHDDMVNFLRSNTDVFSWSASDMPDIPRELIEHRLGVYSTRKPIRQKKRMFALERQVLIDQEVDKLLQAGFIREILYSDWVANILMVPKANGKWRICIDYTDLNKACPKDSYPLPRIDLLIDSTSGHELLSFIDAYSSYNQIKMCEADIPKTTFITDQGLYCYEVMPFGLKNAGATYQRLVNKLFREQVGWNMEVYVNDMLVKSIRAEDHIGDLKEAFAVLRRN